MYYLIKNMASTYVQGYIFDKPFHCLIIKYNWNHDYLLIVNLPESIFRYCVING